eukprot:scaffold15874_cov150-Isochrysis_galbana.AAC.9
MARTAIRHAIYSAATMPNSLFTPSVTRASKANDPHGRAPLLPKLAAVWGPMSPVRPARRLGKIL